MDLATFHRLLSPEGQEVLAAATALQPNDANLLNCHQRLRKKFPEELVKAAMTTVIARQRAAGKFSRAEHMYFNREALEQSSSEVISTYRAARFAPYSKVADLCCGIGGDVIGLSTQAHVIAVDHDPVRLAMAEENLRVYERSGTFLLGDVLQVPLEAEAAFFDPDRRADGKRHLRLLEYVPSLFSVQKRFPASFPLAVKAAPGVPWDDVQACEAEAEFISVDGELKECLLWFGPLRSVARRATVLPNGATLMAEEPARAREPGPPRAFLYDPDPAIVRSGLVANLGEQLDAGPLDFEIAYLTSDTLMPTPFAQGYAIEFAMPFDAIALGKRLRSMNVGPVVLTKRGSSTDVDELRRSWKLKGPETRTVILTRVLGRPMAIVGHRVDAVGIDAKRDRPASRG